ncbi:gliding motility-associated C-terminal domain-containing protein [Algibacter mikhailovii]|uniref:gliding motility-associated C-terminal domain-containing protein n=1 Tax=Algibacter mikhailovii TaxID=425498 RepID=UPI002495A427|nr:gliding motility-associated C-terminal domain-containing protein [Algibacter mikhailovii]
MKKRYKTKDIIKSHLNERTAFVFFLLLGILNGYSQVKVPFAPRSSNTTPETTIYSVKGDFSMIGNTNLTLINYDETATNDDDMIYVDIDGDPDTWNSSSSNLVFSNENGAMPECSNVLYAGLYWFGRTETGSDENNDNDNNPNTFSVTKNNITKNFDKRRVLISGPGANDYEAVFADKLVNNNDEIHYPINGLERNIYTAYADITAYVKDPEKGGIGEYFIADMAVREGSEDITGFSGGWGMVVVYENSKMKWRDITVFDGYAYVDDDNPSDYVINIDGFNATASGDINVKLGIMASEGEFGWKTDFLEIEQLQTGTYQPLAHTNNTTDNFFTSSIITHTSPNMRNPELVNNSGVDIVMFNIDNAGKNIIDNGQTKTSFRYGSDEDAYAIFNLTFAVDAYIPEPVGLLTNTSINGNANPPVLSLQPGEFADFKLELTNGGTEAINNTKLTIPISNSIDPSNITMSFNTFFTTGTGYSPPSYDASIGTNGAIVWELGEFPNPSNPDFVLADISFKLTTTKDCTVLNDPGFSTTLNINGMLSGTGATSQITFSEDLILGYEESGTCQNEPIPAPLTIEIEKEGYVGAPPTATAPEAINVTCLADVPAPDPLIITDATSDTGNAPIVSFVSDTSNGNSCPEIITRVYSVVDDCGSTILLSQTITVNDTIAPVISTTEKSLDSTLEYSDSIGINTALALTPAATDNCTTSPNINLVSDINTPDPNCENAYVRVRTWNFTDDCNNTSADFVQTIIVQDTTAPIIDNTNTTNIEIECGVDDFNELELWLTNHANSTVTNSGDNITWSNDYNSNDAVQCENGPITVTFIASDNCGNSSSTSATYLIKDTNAPVIDTPINSLDVTLECSASDDITEALLLTPTATDNCSASPTLVLISDVSTLEPNCSNAYVRVRTWNFTDDCNNTSDNFVQTITVQDNTPPTLVLPENVTAVCSDDPETINFGTATATDDCDSDVQITFNDVRTDGACAGTYTITRTWTATDICGNTVSADQTISTSDTTPPSFDQTLPEANITVECDAIPEPIELSASDDCGTASVTVSNTKTEGDCDNFYSLARTWTALDECGNTTTFTQTITVQDTKAPVFVETLPTDITVECNAIPEAESITAVDNCGTVAVSIIETREDGDCPSNYILTRTWTATDLCGLTTSHTQKITVEDNSAPVLSGSLESLIDVNCSAIPEAPSLQFTDNCSTNISVEFEEMSTFEDTVLEDYEIIRTWTVRDECNNESIFTQTLHVTLDEVFTEVIAEDRCFEDGIINLDDYIPNSQNNEGIWEIVEGDKTASLKGSDFDPTILEINDELSPQSGGINYVFRYTTVDTECIAVTEVRMNIHADCVVLPCGNNNVVISKAITPNGDGYNDTFDISGIERCGFRAEVKIFNRWGALVYESNDYQIGTSETLSPGDWDGSSSKASIGGSGKLPNGTYYYIVQIKNNGNSGNVGLDPITGPVYLGTK